MNNATNHKFTIYAVILAGGSGTRFWPRSRLSRPKQLCNIADPNLTMIEQTLNRLNNFVPAERRIIVTHEAQAESTRKLTQNLCGKILAEPSARNTAAALALAAFEIERSHRDAGSKPLMVSLHADHVIDDDEVFRADLASAVRVAQNGFLTLVGIKPTFPSTGFGYIERGPSLSAQSPTANDGFAVARFCEKPDIDRARDFLEKGHFYWNSGYFIWRTDTFLNELKKYLPDTFDALKNMAGDSTSLSSVYSSLPKIAIDHAVLEKSSIVAFIPARFGWHDVGSWDALDACAPKDHNHNIVRGQSFLLDVKNCTIDAESQFIAAIGVENLVIVESRGGILVCPKSRAQDVKKVVEFLESQGRKDLL